MIKQDSNKKGVAIAVTLAVIGAVLILGALGTFFFSNQPAGKTFSLVDQNGQAVTEQDFQGKFMLVMFGYTYCPDVCPTGLTVISDALDILGDQGALVTPVFISIDPQRDTPEILKDYVGNFHPRLAGLTGTLEQVAAAAKSFGAEYRKIPPLSKDEENAGDYFMAHSTSTYLTGPEGENLFSFNRQTEPEEMARRIGEILKRIL